MSSPKEEKKAQNGQKAKATAPVKAQKNVEKAPAVELTPVLDSKYTVMSSALIVFGCAILVLFLALMAEVFIEKEQKYYWLDVDDKVKGAIGLNAPFHATPAILKWAGLAAVTAYTYDYAQYETQLDKVRPYFTSDGWDQFMFSLQQAGTFERIADNRLTVSAVVNGAPVVIIQGMLLGFYTWRVKVPLLVTYQGASDKEQQYVILNMLIRRQPTTDDPIGIGIDQIQVQQQSAV